MDIATAAKKFENMKLIISVDPECVDKLDILESMMRPIDHANGWYYDIDDDGPITSIRKYAEHFLREGPECIFLDEDSEGLTGSSQTFEEAQNSYAQRCPGAELIRLSDIDVVDPNECFMEELMEILA